MSQPRQASLGLERDPGRAVMQLYHPDLKDPANVHNNAGTSLRTPLLLLLLSLSLIAGVWSWLGTPVTLEVAPIDAAQKVDCVSYAPFREGQTPWNSQAVISEAQIAQDLAQLAGISKCVRIYSIENGLDEV